ncbi:MAG: PAS domain S-box protein [Anaerolineae bacterium]|nr:PAS domain S-box protein [Anaerolineae bacterium]
MTLLHETNEPKTILHRYGMAVTASVFTVAMTAALWPVLGDAPFILLVGGVVVSAWRGGLLAGMLCAALSILAVDYFLFEPRYEIFTTPTNLLQFIIFGLVAGLISWIEESRARSDRANREYREELEIILNGVTEGVNAQDASGKVVFANAAANAMTDEGLSAAFRSTEKPGAKLLDSGNVTLAFTAMPHHRVFSTGKPAELTFGLKPTESGQERWMKLRSTPVFDKQGKVRLAVNIFEDITDKRRIEKLRAETEERLRKVLDNLAAFVGVMTPDGVLIEANRLALESANLMLEDVIGKPFDQTYWWSYDPDVQAQLRDAIKRVAAGETVRYDVRVRLGEGRFITIDFILAPVLDGRGRVEYLIPSGIDVTARQQLTDQLAVQQRRLESILNSIPGVVYEGTGSRDASEQRMAFISQYAETLFGYPVEDWYTDNNFWQKVVHPDDWVPVTQRATETYLTGDSTPVPFRCVTKDGRILYAESYNGTITGLNGQPVGTCGIVLDVTERRRQEGEIKRLTTLVSYERQRLATIIANVPGIVYEAIGTPERGLQRLDYISSYAETLLGYPVDDWRGGDLWEHAIQPEDTEATLAQVRALFDGQAAPIQLRCQTADGRTVYLEAHSSLIRDERGSAVGATGVMMDITERRHSEDAMAHYAEELRRSNEELEQFAYVASHDLQEPLRMVTSYLQLIEQRYVETIDADGREFIGYAVDGATRMKTLINDLLAYSRIQRARDETEQLNVGETVEQALYNLQLTIEDSGGEVTVDEPLPELEANRIQLVQLFQNLIGNALKFRAPDRPPHVHIGAQREGRFWRFSVRDNGIGIESEYLERIFVIFQRLHARNEYPGTGIGLAICKKIVDKHGGEIHAESTPGEGTTFSFTLPVKRAPRRGK